MIRYEVINYHQSTTLVISLQWLLYISLGSYVVADILIATSICVLLYHSRSGFKSYYVLSLVFFFLYRQNFEHGNQVGFLGYYPYAV